LKAKQKQYAIQCSFGPGFGGGWDLAVSDNCNANTKSYTNFGESYANDTGLDGNSLFAGSQNFQVREIEIFQIAD
jgi:hypothetical protein